ncbi:hypothetical protein R1sor_020229 [Riccia sorocarpa]|uniref:Phosphorylated adapter RNA export protein n=1 Tax=Riccia sorocarpa TaxID=122646 RepID=A0ABD3IJ83_9MARC
MMFALPMSKRERLKMERAPLRTCNPWMWTLGNCRKGNFAEDADHPPARTVNSTSRHHAVFEFKSGCDQVSNDGRVHLECADTSERTSAAARSGRRRPKKRRSGKRKTVDVARFVRETCDHLQEKKISLIWALVKKLGVEAVRDLVKEVDVIEKCGGQMTNDQKRRRTPGGVLWNILKGRVQPQVYKEIMSQGNEVLKQKAREAKETLKRQRMDVDEPENKKRRKVGEKEADSPMARAEERKISWPKPATVFKTGPEALESPADSVKSVEKAGNVTHRLRVPVEYGDVEKGEPDGFSCENDELSGCSR